MSVSIGCHLEMLVTSCNFMNCCSIGVAEEDDDGNSSGESLPKKCRLD